MLLRMGLLLRLGPNVITDGTFITLGSSYYTCAFYRSVQSSHPLWAPPGASRGSAIHVFLVNLCLHM